MDGSYFFKVFKNQNSYDAVFYDDEDNKIYEIYNFPVKEFCKEVKKASNSVIKYIKKDSSLNELENAINTI